MVKVIDRLDRNFLTQSGISNVQLKVLFLRNEFKNCVRFNAYSYAPGTIARFIALSLFIYINSLAINPLNTESFQTIPADSHS